MTIDDIRISTFRNWDTSFAPTRYPWKDPSTVPPVAHFKGQFPVANNVILGSSWYSTIRQLNTQFTYTTNPYYDPADTPQYDGNNKFYGIKKEKWEKLWKDVIETNKSLKSEVGKDWFDYLDDKGWVNTGPNPDQVNYVTNGASGPPYLWQGLLDWYWNKYSGGDPLKLKLPVQNSNPGGVAGLIDLKDSIDTATWQYDFKFYAPRNTTPFLLFQAPVLDDIAIPYINANFVYQEYLVWPIF
jgi:hypothetical protein